MKTAFLFPGQGAQYVGMAKDFYDEIAECREVVEIASNALDFDLKSVMFEPNELINKTEYTQACLLTAEMCMAKAVEKIVKPEITAGLSLGEYAALVTCGAMSFEDSVRTVRARGKFMEYAVPNGKGGMAAVIGLPADVIQGVIDKVTKESGLVLVTANFNCPGQIVISGDKEAVELSVPLLNEAGARLVSVLNVSGPFHSPLLSVAGEELGKVLGSVSVNKPIIPYVTNVTASIVENESDIKGLLSAQVSSAVKWEQSVEVMRNAGSELFIEIGPGKTLAGFMKRIDRAIKIISIGQIADLEKLNAI